MSAVLSCDGCGAWVAEVDAVKLGRVIVRDFCPACAEAAQTYMQLMDNGHTEAVERFETARRCAREQCKLLRYPDEGAPS